MLSIVKRPPMPLEGYRIVAIHRVTGEEERGTGVHAEEADALQVAQKSDKKHPDWIHTIEPVYAGGD
jgi:hypothetical protein